MNSAEARLILENLLERIDEGGDGKYRLPGVFTVREFTALSHAVELLSDSQHDLVPDNGDKTPVSGTAPTEPDDPVSEPVTESVEEEVELDLSVLDLPPSSLDARVCLDFGTAMSKATLVIDEDEQRGEDIRVLRLGVPGDQEEVDEFMLVSSVYIDGGGRIWFGHKAVQESQIETDQSRTRLDNIKRWMSEGNLGCDVEKGVNPTETKLVYADLLLAYLTFYTWAMSESLREESDQNIPANVPRRYAMPCLPSQMRETVTATLRQMLGEAQVLADTFGAQIHSGIPLKKFLAAAHKIREMSLAFDFVREDLTEPLGVAGSLLSWKAKINAMILVVDIGAGTSDFSLFRLALSTDEDFTDPNRGSAIQAKGAARGITEAGNHLDQILKAFILRCAEIDASDPMFSSLAYDLERGIREFKETLFTTGGVLVPLRTGGSVEVSLDDFLHLDAVENFTASLLKAVVETLESVDKSWIDWIVADPQRTLTVVLTGGGASLPMAKGLAEIRPVVNGVSVPVARARSFPQWLNNDYPDLEDNYLRIAVSLGGARRRLIESRTARLTAGTPDGQVLERYATSGV